MNKPDYFTIRTELYRTPRIKELRQRFEANVIRLAGPEAAGDLDHAFLHLLVGSDRERAYAYKFDYAISGVAVARLAAMRFAEHCSRVEAALRPSPLARYALELLAAERIFAA